jgi:hypothetical protein
MHGLDIPHFLATESIIISNYLSFTSASTLMKNKIIAFSDNAG